MENGERPIRQCFYYDCVDSTNERAKHLVRQGVIVGQAYVWAGEQTAGRGTRGRSWVSPKNAGIYLSVVHVLREASGRPTAAYTVSAGVACAEAVFDRTGVEVKLKPINDLYANDKKLGGILTETILSGDRVEAVITGVGINVMEVPRLVNSGAAPPTSLQEVMPPDRFETLSVSGLMEALVERVDYWHRRVFAGRLDALEQAWRNRQLHPYPIEQALR